MAWGSPAEVEKRRRIILAVAAYAYEFMGEMLMSDSDFDAECLKVNLQQPTGDAYMDEWFQNNFEPCTGMWVHHHPGKARLHQLAASFLQPQEQPT